jgi:uncharacterized membrane protein YdjX (TVP38/TMEM64 family)
MTDPNNHQTSEVSETSELPRRFSWLPLAGLLLIVLAGLALWRWGEPVVAFFRDQDQIRAWLADLGPLAPLASIGLNTAQVLLAPVPGQVLGLANGYLFGVFWGTVYSLAGVTLGSALAMGLGRWLGRPAAARLVGAAQLARLDDLAARRGSLFFFLVFLLPLVPDDIACFAVGLSPLSIPYILTLAALGRLPGLIASSWIGAYASSFSPAGWAALGGGALLLAGVVLRYQGQIEAALLRLAERWSGRGDTPD